MKKKLEKKPSWGQIGKSIGTKIDKECCDEKHFFCKIHDNKCGGAIYGLGFIGAVVYYISTATGFWIGVLGFLKALVWPAFLVHAMMKYLGM